MVKLILLALLAGLLWWYFDGSRRMDEAAIRASFAQDSEAMTQMQAEPLCQRMDEAFAMTMTTNGVEQQLDKHDACEDLRDGFETFQRLGARRLPLRVETSIDEIALAADRKSAMVKSTNVIRLGHITLSREHVTERLIRRVGHIRTLGGETRAWVYAGE